MIKNLFLFSMTLMMPQLASAAGSTTVYDITGRGASVTTEVKGIGGAYDKIMSTYLTDRLIQALKEMPGVSSVQLNKGEETTKEYSYYTYKTKNRKSTLFLTMNMPSKVSFLLGLEESYNECGKDKPGLESLGGGEDGGYIPSSSCTLNAVVKITGPLSVYGSFANNSLVGFNEEDLKDLQDLKIDLGKSYDSKDLRLRTEFNVNSMLFERAISRFLNAFNVQGVDMSVLGMSRQNILLGSSRMIRMVNEKLIVDKAGGR